MCLQGPFQSAYKQGQKCGSEMLLAPQGHCISYQLVYIVGGSVNVLQGDVLYDGHQSTRPMHG